jgi:RNA polymerase sigma-70 factor (ECF subfamily)
MTGSPGGDDDAALLERIAHADVDAFEVLYDRYSAAVHSMTRGMLQDPQAAQEVTQDVFLGIWRGARAFDPSRGAPKAWILSLAHHKSVDWLRRARHTVVPLSETITDDADVVADSLRKVEGVRVRRALSSLSLEQRTALVLAYYGGYTQREIARRTGAPLGTIKTRMRDGLLRLRAVLELDRQEIGP